MPQNMVVGLLTAVGVAMSALVGLVHGDFAWAAIVDAAVATGLAAYLAITPKKISHVGYVRTRIDS
jgi:hypothetical protein